MQSNMKQGQCFRCKAKLRIPIPECVVECEQCGRINLFLCHVFDKPANIHKLRMTCPTCRDVYAVIRCPKCSGYCAIKDFINGFLYQCSCKYKTTFIACNSCQQMLSLPADKNYEKTKIRCPTCTSQFRYKLCQTCRKCSYKPGEYIQDTYLCSDLKCPESGSPIQGTYWNNPDSQQKINTQIKQFETQARNQSISFKDVCKVCINQQAIMINTACYHLALCEGCANDIALKRQGQCPICRTKGVFQKIFKP